MTLENSAANIFMETVLHFFLFFFLKKKAFLIEIFCNFVFIITLSTDQLAE